MKKESQVLKTDGPIISILKKRNLADISARSKSVEKNAKLESTNFDSSKVSKLTAPDPYIDAENKEIARLEKLMGIKGGGGYRY